MLDIREICCRKGGTQIATSEGTAMSSLTEVPFSLLHKIMTLSGEPRLDTETSEARIKQPSPPSLKTGHCQADDFAGNELWFTCNWCTCKLHHHGNEQELLSAAFQ